MAVVTRERSLGAMSSPTSQSGPESVPHRQSRQGTRPSVAILSTALVILSGLLLGLVVNIAAISPLRHARDQQVAYAQLRSDLANAVAPIGTTSADGTIRPLGAPVAVLEIPDLGITEVIMNGTTSTVLMSGAGHRRDTVLPGQIGHSVVMGRAWAFGGPFGSIGSLVPGSTFTVVTGHGENTFEVTAVRSGEERPVPLQPEESRLTLVTASGPFPYVPATTVQVDAVLTSDPRPRTSALLPPAFLSPAERPLAGDSSAVLGLVLWSALLLGAAILVVWLRARWGAWQTWVVAVPVIVALGVAVTNHITMLMPNLL